MEYTDGNWTVTKWSSHKHVYISSDINEEKYGSLMFIADCGNLKLEDGLPYNPDVEGNARLISACPDMYKALKEAQLQIEYLHEKFKATGTGNTVLTRIQIALNKAEGK